MQGKVIAVTGGFGVLGQAVAAAAATRGAHVARIDIASAPAAPLAGGADFGGVDITDANAAAGAVASIAQRLGGIDVLVNVAGGFVWQTLQDGGPDIWARMFRLN